MRIYNGGTSKEPKPKVAPKVTVQKSTMQKLIDRKRANELAMAKFKARRK